MNNTKSGCEIHNHRTNQNKKPWEKPSLCCASVHPSELDELAKTWAVLEEVLPSRHMICYIWSCGQLAPHQHQNKLIMSGCPEMPSPKIEKKTEIIFPGTATANRRAQIFLSRGKKGLGRWWNFKSSVHSFTRSAVEEEWPQARPLAPSLDKLHSSLPCSQISYLFQNKPPDYK